MTTPQEVIAHYRPSPGRIPPACWLLIADGVRDALTAGKPSTPWAALSDARALSSFMEWAAVNGLGDDLSRSLTDVNVERFFETALPGVARQTASTYRSGLRRIGRAVNPKGGWLPPRAQGGRSWLAPPYTPAELRALVALADVQPSARIRRAMGVILGLAAGAGLTPAEILAAHEHHLVTRDGVLCVTVPESGEHQGLVRPRTVPILATLGLASLVDAAADVTGWHGRLLGDFNLEVRDPFGKIRERIKLPEGTPPINTRRLRNTWMVAVLNGGVNIRDFMTFAGLRSAKSIEDLAAYVAPAPDGSLLASRAGGWLES